MASEQEKGMPVLVRKTSAELALDEEGFAIPQVPGGFEGREKRRGLRGKGEIKRLGEEITRSTAEEEALS